MLYLPQFIQNANLSSEIRRELIAIHIKIAKCFYYLIRSYTEVLVFQPALFVSEIFKNTIVNFFLIFS
ncbi:MAG: hypothetical protein JWQ54_1489 [Mucilaginibacter sp.]|nr:hypothetical protein [Mucilaginibacter sp.]